MNDPITVAGWVQGLIEDAEPGATPPGSIVDGTNLVNSAEGLAHVRGGSRIMLTLNDDAGSPAEIDHVCSIIPYKPIGGLIVGWSNGQNKHYAWRVTQDMAFSSGTESTSRHSLTAAPSTTWATTAAPGVPVMAELFEKIFIADAVETYSARSELLAIGSTGTVTRHFFALDGSTQQIMKPYCIEEYNNVLFAAGYGENGGSDRPEVIRHSFLGRAPDSTAPEGFDPLAYALIGAKGRRVTAMRKGGEVLLAAKDDEIYRISGFGRAYPGWQYQIDKANNTKGLGIANPNALVFAQGHWYGIGAQGPLRTDGFNVETLVGPRQRGWRAISNVAAAWVQYYPERRAVLFGVHPAETRTGRSASYPWLIWVWDLDRNVWGANWDANVDFFYGSALSTVSAEGPSAPPSSPSGGTITETGFTASWTNGDATAYTEVWLKEGSAGTFTLVHTEDPAGTTQGLTGLPAHTELYWKIRHRANGVYSEFTSEVQTDTLLAVPTVDAYGQADTTKRVAIAITNNNPVSESTIIKLERSPTGAGTWTEILSVSRVGGLTKIYYDTTAVCTTVYDYRAKSYDAAWGTTSSTYSGTESATACTEEAPT